MGRYRTQLPVLVLLLVLSAVFVFGHEGRGLLYRDGHHGGGTAHYMAVSANLSPEHNFLMFTWESENADGNRSYNAYNRFPIGGPALTKLAILPFSDSSLERQLYAARLLTLAFFVTAALLAYLALVRLMAHRWVVFSATLLAFSSPYCLYYADFVNPEAVMDLCGMMLVFHGMVLFVQEGRFRQLLVKTAFALLIGWHVYALLLPFIVIGVIRERIVVRQLLASPYVRLGAFSLCLGVLLLGFNFTNEYVATNATSVTEMPSFRSMLLRFGLNESFNADFAERRAWLPFLEGQFFRIGGLVLPFALYGHIPGPDAVPWLPVVFLGIAITGACAFALARVPQHRMLLTALAVSGFVWALPLRNHTFTHDWLTIFYIGIPLVVLCAVLRHAQTRFGNRFVAVVAVAAVAAFLLSANQMSRVGLDDETLALHGAVVADFEEIRKWARDHTVGIPLRRMAEGFDGLPGSTKFFMINRTVADIEVADVLATEDGSEGAVGLLTPANRHVFLYNRSAYELATRVAR